MFALRTWDNKAKEGNEDVCECVCFCVTQEMGGWEYVDGGDADSTEHIGETNKKEAV